MEKKIFTIAVGRGRMNANYKSVLCTENNIEAIALSMFDYSNETKEFGTMPIMCAYEEGEDFDWYSHNMVVLRDCM